MIFSIAIDEVVKLWTAFEENQHSKIFDKEFFGYYYVTIEQPEYKDDSIVLENGFPKIDSKRTYERIPLTDNILDYFKQNIQPHIADVLLPDQAKLKIGFTKSISPNILPICSRCVLPKKFSRKLKL